MYKAIVRRRVRAQWERLNTAEFDAIVASTAADVRHEFAGENALGGSRRGGDAFARWLARLHRLFPEHRMTIRHIAVAGPPWNTTVTVEWHNDAVPADGADYENDGVHVIRVRWGRTVSIHAYLDTEKVSAACARMAAAGIEEAGAGPIS